MTIIGLKKMIQMNERIELIETYLDKILPKPWCELNFNTDYELLIAIVLSAQTTDKRVNQVTEVMFKKYNNLDRLKEAPLGDLENILRPIGSYRKKTLYVHQIASLLVDKYDYKVPTKRKELEQFPGVGRKTTNVFLSEYYNYPAFAVDTHVERVSKRLGLVKESDTVIDIENKLKRKIKRDNWSKRHKQFVLFGRYYCKAKNPDCSTCPLINICKTKKND